MPAGVCRDLTCFQTDRFRVVEETCRSWRDSLDCRLVRLRGIQPLIARRRSEHGSGLGRERWVVERTISHLHNKRRLLLRTDRSATSHEALLSLAACLLCYGRLRRSFC
jgi:transposase